VNGVSECGQYRAAALEYRRVAADEELKPALPGGLGPAADRRLEDLYAPFDRLLAYRPRKTGRVAGHVDPGRAGAHCRQRTTGPGQGRAHLRRPGKHGDQHTGRRGGLAGRASP